jgi:hypothetical protein
MTEQPTPQELLNYILMLERRIDQLEMRYGGKCNNP